MHAAVLRKCQAGVASNRHSTTPLVGYIVVHLTHSRDNNSGIALTSKASTWYSQRLVWVHTAFGSDNHGGVVTSKHTAARLACNIAVDAAAASDGDIDIVSTHSPPPLKFEGVAVMLWMLLPPAIVTLTLPSA
jgi:hypothetical protein